MEKIDYNNKNMRSYKKCKDANQKEDISVEKCKDVNQKEDTSVEYEEVGKKRKMIFLNVELYVKKIWKRIIMQPHVMGMSRRICMIQRPIRWIYVQMVFILQMY